jgi:hypothetical protein
MAANYGMRRLFFGPSPATLCDLVAHHSGSAVEAEERGLGRELAEFGPPDRHARLLSVLTAAGMTTGPGGDPMSATARIAEILSSYAVDDVVIARCLAREVR